MIEKTYRPILELPKSRTETILNIIGALFFLGSIIYTFMSWGSLPDKIPAHFNGLGEVDRYGAKVEVFILPIIGVFIWLLLGLVERKPHIHNYPARLNETNVEAFYLSSRRLLNVLKNVCLLMFSVITIQMIRIALDEETAMGEWVVPSLLVVLFVTLGIGFIKQSRIK